MLGRLHHGRKRVQPAGSDVRSFYEDASDLLKFPLLTFGQSSRQVIADTFGDVVTERNYTC